MTESTTTKAPTLRDLREWSAATLDRQYRAGVLTDGRVAPEGVPQKRVDSCELCDCVKSGDVVEANPKEEWCADYACRCHDEDARDSAVLYLSNTGHVSCAQSARCIGGYAFTHLQAHPTSTAWFTPLDHWTQATDADAAEWLADLGTPLACESCGAVYASPVRLSPREHRRALRASDPNPTHTENGDPIVRVGWTSDDTRVTVVRRGDLHVHVGGFRAGSYKTERGAFARFDREVGAVSRGRPRDAADTTVHPFPESERGTRDGHALVVVVPFDIESQFGGIVVPAGTYEALEARHSDSTEGDIVLWPASSRGHETRCAVGLPAYEWHFPGEQPRPIPEHDCIEHLRSSVVIGEACFCYVCGAEPW